MGRIPQHFLDELIARTDIVELISARVPLKKSGREYKACCPFHAEKTPSFWVSPDKQFYHCFGCGKHGTALGFLMEHDHLPFPEAVEELATRLGLEVPREGGAPQSARRPEEPLYELLERVARFYADQLQREPRARAYLAKRALSSETVERFAIGYAPNSWNELLRRFGAGEAERKRLLEAGLIVERGGGREGERYYDRFRDRVMFPIRDARGRVIAFGGRIIDTGEPKYLNSPETVLFHKGRELYGLYETRRARRSLDRLVVVEGYMDAVSLHQSGIDYAVATLGTATTLEHLRRLFRLVPTVVFAFDGDRAGRAAAWRALQQALPEAREGREIRFLFLPQDHDPDTLVRAEGAAAFEQRLAAAVPLSEYLVRELTEHSEPGSADGRARFAELARPLFARVPEGVYRELLLERLAQVIGLPPDRLLALWTATPGTGKAAPSASSAPARPASARSPRGAGRGSLVRQAIIRLLHYPPIALEVTAAERAGLDASEEAGVPLLRELLDSLREQPAQIPAQVIQRWMGHRDGETLQKLLAREEVIMGASAAAGELRSALVKLADQAAGVRLQALEAKSRAGSLAGEELVEFQSLIERLSQRDARRG